ncbi:MAG: rRNA maturation RNase YbeY, partial [Solirubrobacterales bacterium]
MSSDLEDVPETLRPPVEAALAGAGVSEGHLSLELVDPQRIRELNSTHRGRDRVTDVLSFPIDGTAETVGPRELGDVFICPSHTADLEV